ncbi:hypothetical protein DVH05_005944 [Phytophthora capsici]|nr:hypothetical protein DVH05_005944 [Phytophthora capsici]
MQKTHRHAEDSSPWPSNDDRPAPARSPVILNHGRLRALSTALFVECAPVDVHIYMDASDAGLVALHPARRQYIQLRFDDLECTQLAQGSPFTINVRELFGVALAAWVFGPTWTTPNGAITLVRAWVYNTSAVSWNNRRYSSNPMAQELSRPIGLAEGYLTFGSRLATCLGV